jgi:hypothetical protein
LESELIICTPDIKIKHLDLYFQTPKLRHDPVLGYKDIETFRDLRNSYAPESATQVGVEYTYG